MNDGTIAAIVTSGLTILDDPTIRANPIGPMILSMPPNPYAEPTPLVRSLDGSGDGPPLISGQHRRGFQPPRADGLRERRCGFIRCGGGRQRSELDRKSTIRGRKSAVR